MESKSAVDYLIAVARIIDRMRNNSARFREVPGGSDVVSASAVDTWADELDEQVFGSVRVRPVSSENVGGQ